MKFIEAIKFGFQNYFNFKGTVSRSIFWYWAIFLVITFNISRFLPQEIAPYWLGAFFLVFLIPTLALMIRRLRDAGLSPFLMLIWILPIFFGLNAMQTFYASDLAQDPIAEGNAGYIPVHMLATGFMGLVVVGLAFLIALVVMAVLWLQPTKSK